MEATLRVYGVIGTGNGEFSSDNIVNFIDNNPEATDLTIRIKSPGGSVREGWTIYDLLKNSGKNIKTIAEGELYSIATVIFLAGSEREIFPNADGLIHMPRIPNPEGDFQAADLRDMAEYMDQEENKILNLYRQITGKDEVTLRDYMTKETMLSAEDMLSLGFATKITEPLKAVAYFNYKTSKMEKDEVKTFGEKLDAIADTVKALFSRLPSKDQVMTDKDGKELKLEKEAGGPVVGDAASPDGTYTMEDGKMIVVADGKVTEITEPMEAKSELEIANEKIAALEAELATAKATQTSVDAEKAALAEETTKATALVAELTALKSTWKPEGRSKSFANEAKIGEIDLNRVRELKAKLNNK